MVRTTKGRMAVLLAALVWLTACASAPQAEPEPQPQPQRYSGVLLTWFEGQSFRADGETETWAFTMSPEAMRELAQAYPEDYAPSQTTHTAIAVDVEGVLRPVDPAMHRYGCVGGCYDHYLAISRVHQARLLRSACTPILAQVYFGTNAAALDAQAAATLDAAVHDVRRHACNVSRVSVVGHADRVGSAARNLALSEARAGAVRDALVARGVDAVLVMVEGAGEERPLLATADNVSEPINRVVEITFEAPAAETD